MIDNNDWLIKPDNYRLLQTIRKRIRSVYGDDIRITSNRDVRTLFLYRNREDTTLGRMLAELERRIPAGSRGAEPVEESRNNSTLRVYRGRVISA